MRIAPVYFPHLTKNQYQQVNIHVLTGVAAVSPAAYNLLIWWVCLDKKPEFFLGEDGLFSPTRTDASDSLKSGESSSVVEPICISKTGEAEPASTATAFPTASTATATLTGATPSRGAVAFSAVASSLTQANHGNQHASANDRDQLRLQIDLKSRLPRYPARANTLPRLKTSSARLLQGKTSSMEETRQQDRPRSVSAQALAHRLKGVR